MRHARCRWTGVGRCGQADAAGQIGRLTLGCCLPPARAAAALTSPPAARAGGFQPVQDLQDNYSFAYPQGWEEVRVEGLDRVYKDLIEPLESVSVTILPTQTAKLTDLGDANAVAPQFIDKVLATPGSKFNLLEASTRETEGQTYYTFIYKVEQSGLKRFGVSTISIKEGKFYVLTTGASERRWNKMKGTLLTMASTFKNLV